MPVHIGGLMMDAKALSEFAEAHNLGLSKMHSARALPSAWRGEESGAVAVALRADDGW